MLESQARSLGTRSLDCLQHNFLGSPSVLGPPFSLFTCPEGDHMSGKPSLFKPLAVTVNKEEPPSSPIPSHTAPSGLSQDVPKPFPHVHPFLRIAAS